MNPIELLHQIGLFALLTLLIDTVPLIAAASYASRPSEGKLVLMRPFSLAALFAGTAGSLNGLLNMLQGLARTPDMTGRWGPVYGGASEALVPAVFGLTCLTVAWLLVAVGMWRGVREA
ncbi:MAG: hypothetical protein ABI634_11325 [Acidobacteriota bacterium]